MTAFFVATVKMKDPEKFQLYAKKAAETFQPHGGQLVARGKLERALTGSADHQAAALIRFPSMDALSAWYDSDAYQDLIPLRDAAADMTITAYAEMT